MTQRIAILGAGVMGETLLAAILRSGHSAADLVISEKRDDRAAELRETYAVEVTGNAEAVGRRRHRPLVVKPQDVAGAPRRDRRVRPPGATVVSLAAGTTIATIEAALPDGVAVVRAMPNTPALVGEGMFGISPGPRRAPTNSSPPSSTCSRPAARSWWSTRPSRTPSPPSPAPGPAYVFYLAEAMIAGGVEAGLDEATARMLAAQTLVGSAKLLAESDETADELRRRVTSPNGTTHAAITTFDERGVKDALVAGVLAAAARSAELSAPQ